MPEDGRLIMHKQREATLKPGQAALVVTYGNTTRRFHPLEGDLVVLGRSANCDITLVSPEIASTHCILQRRGDGWCLRDCCGGRHATRLNGRVVREEKLSDCDVVQIGTFSFEMRLPVLRPTPVVGASLLADERLAARIKSLQRSRRNLIRIALRLRHKARRGTSLPPTFAELERQAESLRSLQRDYQRLVQEYEGRLNQLEQAERELCDARTAFEQECTEKRIGLEKAEHEMVRSIRDRLADLPRIKQEIAGSSGSAPGEQLRADVQEVTEEEEAASLAR
jgi:pSer/pThr/pTyr-binding forkhead associated (FHA) protein